MTHIYEKCVLNRSKCSSIHNVQRLSGPNTFAMYCLSLTHAVSQAKCQKSYVLNTLVLEELIINLSLHSRSTKIKLFPHILNYIQNHWPIRFQYRPAEARAFFADHPTAEAKALGTRLPIYYRRSSGNSSSA
jgi:inhibitor of KinA sporulation pathway (predicted exonuclease)